MNSGRTLQQTKVKANWFHFSVINNYSRKNSIPTTYMCASKVPPSNATLNKPNSPENRNEN